nr:N-6 DNA methylase [Xanthomonas citri]
MLFINAAGHFAKGKRQNQLTDEHIQRIVGTYQNRSEQERYSRCVSMKEIAENDYNLNISRYVSTAEADKEVVLDTVHADLTAIESKLKEAKKRHNAFLVELGLMPLP